jgi:hypothetical protein
VRWVNGISKIEAPLAYAALGWPVIPTSGRTRSG